MKAAKRECATYRRYTDTVYRLWALEWAGKFFFGSIDKAWQIMDVGVGVANFWINQ